VLKKALVLGGGGFIGNHMVTRLKLEGFWVRAVDLKRPEFSESEADEFYIGDLRSPQIVEQALKINAFNDDSFDEIYQFAADMGGAGFVFSGENDADIMHNSSLINLNVLDSLRQIYNKSDTEVKRPKIFYSSSACMYPEHNQMDPDNPKCDEESAYPAAPDSEYGWEKLFSERLFLAFNRNFGIKVAIARFHNIYGPLGTWEGGREKAPAAICRKVASVIPGDSIEVWGDGKQTRSFLYIDDCIEAVRRLMSNDNFIGPVNIGSEEMVTINQLVQEIGKIAGKKFSVIHIPGPLGVRGRNSDNTLIRSVLEWEYEWSLEDGLKSTYAWIEKQIQSKNKL
jgi:nucleoside-diphosphate-sugar epimerase